MTRDLKLDIRWFQDEMALCEQAIREVLAGASGPAQDRKLEGLRANLASHKQTLADLLALPEAVEG